MDITEKRMLRTTVPAGTAHCYYFGPLLFTFTRPVNEPVIAWVATVKLKIWYNRHLMMSYTKTKL
jgi:hypothetical protein